MSYNIDYASSSVVPFGGMTKDMLHLLKLMKTEKFICLQTLGAGNTFYTLRGQESEDEFSVGVENVMAINPCKIEKMEVISSWGKNIPDLAKAVDKEIIKKILEFGDDCEELELDTKEGLSPSIRSAGVAISSKLMRLSRLAVVSNKRVIRTALSTISEHLATIATGIDYVIVFNAGRNNFDGGVFFIPLALDKRTGFRLEYLIVTDNAALNFMKLVEPDAYEESELTLDHELPEREADFIKGLLRK
jgi:hypothetical protein